MYCHPYFVCGSIPLPPLCRNIMSASVASVSDQSERSFQKQSSVFLNKKATAGAKVSKKAGNPRYYKSVGLGFRTPKEAISGTYIDKKCPFTSNVSIRGRILKGVVKSFKMKNTLVIRRDYLHFIPKYHRFEKRHSTVAAHVSPCFRINEGDQVVVGECRYVQCGALYFIKYFFASLVPGRAGYR